MALIALGGLVLLGAIMLAVSGCSTPTKAEKRLYTIETNQIPVVEASNTPSGPVLTTNWVPVTQFTVAPGTQKALETVGMFGPTGELVAAIVGSALLAWAAYRNNRNREVARLLAESIETGTAAPIQNASQTLKRELKHLLDTRDLRPSAILRNEMPTHKAATTIQG